MDQDHRAEATASIVDNSLTLDYGANQNGTANITIRATDTTGNYVDTSFVVTVNPVADTPTVVNTIANVSVSEDAPNTVLDLTNTFADVDILTNNDSLTLTVFANDNATLVTASIVDNSLTLDYGANQNGTANITIRATDTTGNYVDTGFVVTVNPVADTPTVANAIANVSVSEDASNTVLDLTNTFADVDILTNNDSLTLTVFANDNATLVTASIVDNSLTLDYGANQNGTANITIRATDTTGNYVDTSFVVTVNPVADTPTVANAIANVSVSEDASNTVLDLTNTFADVDILTNNDSLTLTVFGNDNATLVTASIVDNSLTLDYQPNQNGTANITIRATDTTGNYVDTSFVVTVNPVADTPTVANAIANVSVSEDASNTVLDLTNTFADVDILTNNDSLTLTVFANDNATLVTASIVDNSLTLDYGANQNGTANITIRATDTTGNYVDTSFVVTVNPVADTPTVANAIANVSVSEDAPNTVLDLTNTFADVDILTNNDSLTLTVFANDNATLVTASIVDNSLTLDYQPNQNGTANITIRATDTTGNYVDTSFVVTVNPVADTPTVANAIANVAVSEDAPNTVLDLTNTFADVDILTNGDSLTLTVFANDNATLVTASIVDNSLTLDYGANQNGTANITIRATDTTGNYVDTSFVVTVNPVADTPTVANAIANVSVSEDASNTVLDLTNTFADVDILTNNDSLTLTVFANDNATLVTASIVDNSLTLDYQPNQNGTANITIRATDTTGNYVDTSFVVTVNPVADTPTVANAIANVSVSEDAPNTVLDLTNTFADVDILTNNDSLTLTVFANDNATLVTASIVDNSLTLDYSANQNGTANITIRATDTTGNYVDTSFVVTVDPVADTPTVANAIANVSVSEDAPNTVLDLTNTFADVDILTNGDSLTLTVFANDNATLVTASIVDNSLTLDYQPNQNGTANITIRATDTTGNYVDTSFVVTVNPVADTPTVANAIANVSVNEDAPNTVLDLTNTFADVDILTNNDSLTLTVFANDNATLVTASIVDNSLTLDYSANQNGTANITIRATDTTGNYVDTSFVVTVNPVADTPTVANAIANVSVSEDASNTVLDLTNTFADVDILTNNDSLTLTVFANDNATLVTASIVDNSLTLDYSANQNGTANITIRATDTTGNYVDTSFVVTVNPVADTPTVANAIANVSVSEDASNTVLDLTNTFADVDILTNNDSLTLTVFANDNATLVTASIVDNSLTLDYQPNQNGTANITIRATDTTGNYVDTSFVVTVNPVADTPTVANAIANVSVIEDAPNTVLDLTNTFADVDILTNNDSLTLTVFANDNATLVTASIVDNSLTLDYGANQNGTANITIRATDTTGNYVDTSFVVTVNPVADTPTVANAIANVSVSEDAPNTVLDLTNTFADVDILTNNDSLTLSVFANDNATLVTASIVDNALTLDYGANQNGTANITIRATDTTGNYVDTTFVVTVNPVADTPTVANAIANVSVSEDAPNTVLDLTNTFADVDILTNNDSLTLTVFANDNATLVTASIVDNSLTLDYGANQNGTANITIRATDTTGNYVDTSFVVTVDPVADTPTVANAIANVSVSEDAPNTVLDLTNTFADVDILTNNDSLTLTVFANDNATLVTASIVDNSLTLDYGANQNGTANITIRATDTTGNYVDTSFVVTVNPVADTPTVANAIANVSVSEDAPNTVLDLTNTFADVDILTNNDSLTLTVFANDNATLVTASIVDNSLTLDYGANQNGTANITIRATDTTGNYVDTSFVVTVNPVADTPTVANAIANVSVSEDASNTVLDLTNTFADVDILTNNDSLTLTVFGNDNTSLVTASIVDNSLTLDYGANQNGTANITIRATDTTGNYVDTSFVVTVDPVADTPTVANAIANVSVSEDASNTVLDLTNTFADVDILTNNDSLTLTVFANDNATLVTASIVDNSLTLDYQPNQNGTANITIRATDTTGNYVDTSFVVTVNPVADTPTVANAIANVSVIEDAPNTVLDLTNTFADVDILTNNDSLTLTVFANDNATLVTASIVDNSLTLDYGANQNGTANITIRATDTTGNYVDTSFVVTVNPVADTPTVANAIANVSVSEDASNTVLDLTNTFADVDILTNNDSLTLTVFGNDNTSLVTASIVDNSLTLDYGANQNGTANITIRATDTTGNYVDTSFVVTVDPVADTPTVANAIANVSVSEDASNTVLDLTNTFADVDILTNNDSLTLTVFANDNATLVTASIVDNSLTLDYQPNQNGTANITIRATDTTGNYVDTSFVVTVNPVADTPTVANAIANVSVIEDAPNTVLDLTNTFADVDILTNNDSLTLTVFANDNATLVTASIVDNSLTLDYGANQNGTANITIRATDTTGNYVDTSFVVTVNPVADTPTVANAIANVSVSEDASNTVLDLTNTFADVDILTNNDSLTLSVFGNDNTSLVTASIVDNSLTLDYGANQNGTANITIRATDTTGNYVDTSFVVTVNPVADTPTVANVIADVSVSEDAPNTVLDLTNTFADVDILTNNDSLTLSVFANDNATLVTASIVDNSLTLDYGANQNGTANITIRVTDTTGNYVDTSFVVTVNPVADTPTVANAIADVSVSEDAPNTVLDLTNTFADVDILTNNDSLTLTVFANDNATLVTASIVDNSLTLDYGANQNGTANITIRATDTTGNYVDTSFVVTVNPVADTPTVANAIANVSVNEDAPNTVLDLTNTFADVDILTNNDSLTLTVFANDNATLVTASIVDNSLTLDYGANQNGTANITIRATDTTGNYVDTSFVVTVNPVADTPTVANAIANVSVSEDAPNTVLDLTNTFADVDILTNNDSLTLTVFANDNAALVTASIVDNALTLDYGANQNGTANITIRATDTTGNYVDTTFVVTVDPVADTPTVANVIADVSVSEDAPNTVLDLTNTFADVDILTNNDSLTLTVFANDNATLVTASIVDNALTLDYSANQNGTANITIRATDTTGNYVDTSFAVIVKAVNDIPTIANSLGDITVDFGTPNSVLDLTNTFKDVDMSNNADTLIYTIANNTNIALVNTSIVGNTLTLFYQPNQFGMATITVRATDSAGAFVEDTFSVTVNVPATASASTSAPASYTPNVATVPDPTSSGWDNNPWVQSISAGSLAVTGTPVFGDSSYNLDTAASSMSLQEFYYAFGDTTIPNINWILAEPTALEANGIDAHLSEGRDFMKMQPATVFVQLPLIDVNYQALDTAFQGLLIWNHLIDLRENSSYMAFLKLSSFFKVSAGFEKMRDINFHTIVNPITYIKDSLPENINNDMNLSLSENSSYIFVEESTLWMNRDEVFYTDILCCLPFVYSNFNTRKDLFTDQKKKGFFEDFNFTPPNF